jgi:6-phosphofructokinase
MARNTKIGILTGGGDVPGLNAVIKSVVYGASGIGRGVLGIRRGWKGLTHANLSQGVDPAYVLELNRNNTRTIDRDGGTMLHTSRTNPRRMSASKVPAHISAERLKTLSSGENQYDFTPIVIENLERLGIGCLIAIGGDDTLSFAAALSSKGFPVIAVPKTMDNDVHGTEYCIGFSTAITRAKEAINRQRTILGSHERIGVFRLFGRDAGFTALYSAYVTGARCLIPEYPFDLDRAIDLLMSDKKSNSSGYALVVASEGAIWQQASVAELGEADAYGHRKKVNIGEALADEIKKRTGEETIASDLTYDLRGGAPDAIDHIVATTFGNIALDLMQSDISGRMVSILDGKYAHSPLPASSAGARRVNVEKLYDTGRYRPKYGSKLGSPILF